MPELPEVETIVNDLRPYLMGRYVVDVSLLDAKILPLGLDAFRSLVLGRSISTLKRRAKYIIANIADDLLLVVHLGMTGRLILRANSNKEERFVRLVLHLDNGWHLIYADQRKFGHLEVMTSAEWARRDERIGPEPLSDAFTVNVLAGLLQAHKGAIKPILLNQRVIAGIGNIYADESLYEARLHPERPSNSLNLEEVRRLHSAISATLARGINNRGTTFSDYRDGQGRPGANQNSLAVYRQEGKPCLMCGASIKRLRLAGRSSHYCPVCQESET